MSLLKRIERNQTPESQEQQPGQGSKLQELRVRRASPSAGSRGDTYTDLKNRIQQKLIAELDPSMDVTKTQEVRTVISEMFETMLAEEQIVLSRNEKRNLFEQIVAEILGYGPLEKYLGTDGVTEIMVNGPQQVFIEQSGQLTLTKTKFEDNDHLLRIIDRIVAPLGRRIDENSPMVDARLPDGSRVNAVIPPIALDGPSLTIRLFSKVPLTIENLIEFGTITREATEFIKACVIAKLNVIVSGGTGSGKTTLLNILSSFIPNGDRVVTIENAAVMGPRSTGWSSKMNCPPSTSSPTWDNTTISGAVGFTVMRNSLRASAPCSSRTMMVISASPTCEAEGVSVTVRLVPAPPKTMLVAATNAVLLDTASSVSDVGDVSTSPISNAMASVDVFSRTV